MNRTIGMASALGNAAMVLTFAASMLVGSPFLSYLSSMGIALTFVPMICAFSGAAGHARRTAGLTAIAFAAIYAGLILLVYFAQLTTVRLEALTTQAAQLLDFAQFGLFFSYDLLGYGMMALSTFFAGMTIVPEGKGERWLRTLLLVHGAFVVPCLLAPMLGVFSPGMQGADWIGTVLLEGWCLFFLPIGMLAFRFFRRRPAEI